MKKVLIVDDEATVYGKCFLERQAAGLKGVVFADLQDVATFDAAIALIKREQPDVILLDGYYGVEQLGPELVEWVKNEYPKMKIIGNSSAPKIWQGLDIMASQFKFGPDVVKYLQALSAKSSEHITAQEKGIGISVTISKSTSSAIRWDKIAIVRDNLTGEHNVLFTFDEPEQKQREGYEDADKRSRLMAFLQLDLPKPTLLSNTTTQRAALEHLQKLLNDEFDFSQDCVALLEKVLDAVFKAGLEVGFETRASLERVSA